MSDLHYGEVILDPDALSQTLRRLAQQYELAPNELMTLMRIVELFPRKTRMYFDISQADIYTDVPFVDKFTFDIETDDLILLSTDFDTLVDALIEMAMYLSGFATKIGNQDTWVIDFAIGAWKPVKHHIKRELDILTSDQPRGVVGLRPQPDEEPEGDPYPFRTLVSHLDQMSFEQMIMLAARNDVVTVYFPPGTHPKVRAVYTHARRAIEGVGQHITLHDHRIFNLKLNNALRRIDQLFEPKKLAPPNWIARLLDNESSCQNYSEKNTPSDSHAPFDAFIEQLFSDEDE